METGIINIQNNSHNHIFGHGAVRNALISSILKYDTELDEALKTGILSYDDITLIVHTGDRTETSYEISYTINKPEIKHNLWK